MEREPVESSLIVSAGYDAAASMLEVEFERTGIYQYYGVPIAVYEAFLASDSKGQFFNARIRNRYRSARV